MILYIYDVKLMFLTDRKMLFLNLTSVYASHFIERPFFYFRRWLCRRVLAPQRFTLIHWILLKSAQKRLYTLQKTEKNNNGKTTTHTHKHILTIITKLALTKSLNSYEQRALNLIKP